jgi:hypothetical protein
MNSKIYLSSGGVEAVGITNEDNNISINNDSGNSRIVRSSIVAFRVADPGFKSRPEQIFILSIQCIFSQNFKLLFSWLSININMRS